MVVFVPLDLVAALIQGRELQPLLPALVGRAISYWLLWLLFVEIPLWGRSLAEAEGAGRAGRVRAIVAGTLATGGFVFLWTLTAPTAHARALHARQPVAPSIVSILPLQLFGWALAGSRLSWRFAVYAVRNPDDLLGARAARRGDCRCPGPAGSRSGGRRSSPGC